MRHLNRFLLVVFLTELTLLYVQTSQALFSDTAASSSNTFSASLEFPTPTLSIANHLVINEVYYDVDASHTLDDENSSEWVEIYNPTSSSVDLTSWTIEDNNGSDSLTGSLSAGSFLILIATDSASFQNIWSVPSGTNIFTVSGLIGGNFGLANDGDILTLKNNTVEIDKMSWEGNISGFLTGCAASCPGVAEGHSLERNPNGYDTNDANDFDDTNPPTPGS